MLYANGLLNDETFQALLGSVGAFTAVSVQLALQKTIDPAMAWTQVVRTKTFWGVMILAALTIVHALGFIDTQTAVMVASPVTAFTGVTFRASIKKIENA